MHILVIFNHILSLCYTYIHISKGQKNPPSLPLQLQVKKKKVTDSLTVIITSIDISGLLIAGPVNLDNEMTANACRDIS